MKRLVAAALCVSILCVLFPLQAFASELNYVAGIRTGSDSTVDDVLEAFEKTIGTFTRICDRENERARAQGIRHCPFSTCFVESESDGQTPPPELKFEISYNSDMSSSVTGVASDSFTGTSVAPRQQVSGGIVTTTNQTSKQGIVVKLALTIWLGKRPDRLKCVNPMGEAMREDVVKTVLDIASGNVGRGP